MSIKAISWAFNTIVGNPIRKLILIKIADNANDHGYCWPSLKTIAGQTEVSKDSVIRHIKALEKIGLLKTIKRKKDGVNLPNHYYLNFNNSEEGVVALCYYPPQSATKGSSTVLPKPSLEPSLSLSHEHERLLAEVQKLFPGHRLPKNLPTRNLDYFLFLLAEEKVVLIKIGNPTAYIKSLLFGDDYIPYDVRQARREEKARQEAAREEKDRVEQEKIKAEIGNERFSRADLERLKAQNAPALLSGGIK